MDGKTESGKKYGKLIKVLQIISFVFMLAMLVFNVLWSLLRAKGDLSNPFTFLYALPALLFAIAASVFMRKRQNKKLKQRIINENL